MKTNMIQDIGYMMQTKEEKTPYVSYKNLEIYQLAHRLATEIHKMTIEELPKFELYKESSQVRRSLASCILNHKSRLIFSNAVRI